MGIENIMNPSNHNYYFNLDLLHRKIRMRASFSIIRVFLLYLCYVLDNQTSNAFLEPLITIFLIHECIVLSNYIQHEVWIILNRIHSISNPILVSKIVDITDIFANFLYFIWFCYGNYLFMYDKLGIIYSLEANKYLTYYVTMLLLTGYFLYSRIIFILLFVVAFFPCLLFIYLDDYLAKERRVNRMQLLRDNLKEEEYWEYCKRVGMKINTIKDNTNNDSSNISSNFSCIICTNDFLDEEKVIGLQCNIKHVYHAKCIRRWVEMRQKCPLCRRNVIDEYNDISDISSEFIDDDDSENERNQQPNNNQLF